MSGICDHDPIPSQIDLEEAIAAHSKKPVIPDWVRRMVDEQVAIVRAEGGISRVSRDGYEAYAYREPTRICWGVDSVRLGENIDRDTIPLKTKRWFEFWRAA